jgi:hypothetical protein
MMRLFIPKRGLPQGDPPAMPFYALSTIPLMAKLPYANQLVGTVDEVRKLKIGLKSWLFSQTLLMLILSMLLI